MKIDRKQLQKALEVVKPGLASKALIEQSGSFAFLEDKVVTYNDSISLSHPVEQLDMVGAVRAEELYGFLQRSGEDEIQMKRTDSQLKLKSGYARAGLKLQHEIVLPLQEIGQVDTWHEISENFVDNLNFIKDSAASDKARRVLTCINIEESYMEASDSLQIMRVYLDYEDKFPFPGTLLPAENIPNIVKINPVEIGKTEGWLHFRNRQGVQISCRILVDTYVETTQHFEEGGQKVVFPKAMSKILDRVMVFTKKDDLMDEEMQVTLEGNRLSVYGKNEYGWFKEKAPVKYEGEKASFWISPSLLKSILSRSADCLLGKEKIKFEGDDWEYVALLREGNSSSLDS